MALRIPTVELLFNFVLSNIPQIYFIQSQVFHRNSVTGQAVFKKKTCKNPCLYGAHVPGEDTDNKQVNK